MMIHTLDPVHFPAEFFHARFHVAVAGQDPWPIVARFLQIAADEGLIDPTPVIGRELTPLGYVAILEDGRRRAPVFVSVDERRYAAPFTLFPSLDNLRRWYRLARAVGDARLMGSSDEDDDPARVIAGDPEGVRWCPTCEGINLLSAARCVWCRQTMPPARRTLPPGAPSDTQGERYRAGR